MAETLEQSSKSVSIEETLEQSSKSVSIEDIFKCMKCPRNVVGEVVTFALIQYLGDSPTKEAKEKTVDAITISLKKCGSYSIRNKKVDTCPIIDKYGDPES